MTLVVALGADHGGLSLKTDLVPWLDSLGYQVTDMGAYSLDPDDDYPDFAEAVARAVTSGQSPALYAEPPLVLQVGNLFAESDIIRLR